MACYPPFFDVSPERGQVGFLPARPDDDLECDEAWSFELKKVNKRWLWTVMCRRTRQIIAFIIGDRSEKTCRRLEETA
jgi:insertion element IS1 protein InsB